MAIKKKSIIKEGKIIQNYLVNFPQYLDKKPNCSYKLVIQSPYFTSFKIILTDKLNISFAFDFESALNYDFTIYFGDGQFEKFSSQTNQNSTTIQHTYQAIGTYIIKIYGQHPNLKQFEGIDNQFRKYLTQIIYLGNSFTTFENTFSNCENLSIIPQQYLPDSVKNCYKMFYNCTNLKFIPESFNLPLFCQNAQSMFQKSGLVYCFNQSFSLPETVKYCNRLFAYTKIYKMPKYLFNNCKQNLTELNEVFLNCSNLYNIEDFNLYEFTSLSSAISLFQNTRINFVNNSFNFPNSIKNVSRLFYNCSLLTNIGSLCFNSSIENYSNLFYNCTNLKSCINNIFPIQLQLNTTYDFTNLFYNCNLIYGRAPQQKFWFNQNNDFKNVSNLFYNCISLQNYNSIPTSYGGPTDFKYQNLILYEIKIPEINYSNQTVPILYVLPLHKSNNNINFQINYGDSLTWYQFNYISLDYSNDRVFINDSTSIFNGYLKGINAIYNIQDDKITVYNQYQRVNIFNQLMNDIQHYDTLLRNVCHIYKNPGRYTIKIKCNTPVQFYINQQDYQLNKYLTKIYLYQNLQDNLIDSNDLKLSNFSHAFANAYNLQELPNFEIPSSVLQTDYMFYLSENLQNNKITKIPNDFTLYKNLSSIIISSQYMFYNFFKESSNLIKFESNMFKSLPNAQYIQYMFYNCNGLSGIIPSTWWKKYDTIEQDDKEITEEVQIIYQNKTFCFYNCQNFINYNQIPNSFKDQLE